MKILLILLREPYFQRKRVYFVTLFILANLHVGLIKLFIFVVFKKTRRKINEHALYCLTF
jgi:hypothetical protein